MALKITLLAALLAMALGRPEGTAPLASCQLSIEVVYPTDEGAAPYPVCSSKCPTGEDDGLWYEGVAYKRFCDLEPFNLMVEATFEDGQLKECKMVPYATTEELIAQKEAQQAAVDECLDEPEDVSSTFVVIDSTYAFLSTTSTVAETTTPAAETTTTTTTVRDSTRPPTTEMQTTVRDSTTPPTTEMPTTPAAPSTTSVPPFERCDEGFTRVGDSCYMVSPTTMTMMEGAGFCDAFGAAPASIDSQEEQDLVKAKLSTDVWIGFNDIGEEGRFMNPGQTEVSYTNWNSGEPNNFNNNEDCTMMIGSVDYRWNDADCQQQARILCEQPLIMDTRQYTCPEGYLQREDSCYLLSDQTGDFAEGEQFCSSIGGYPVFFNSQEEQNFLAEKATENVYIGLNDRATEGTFLSENFGVPLYTSWYDGEPNDYDNEDCTEAYANHGLKWNDCKCDLKRKMLCEVSATPVPIFRCPDGTANFEDSSCFLAAGTFATGTYDDAVNFCNGQGMSVATIRSPEEQAFAAELLKDNTWISLTDAATEGVFVWGDGSPLEYASFGDGEPNDLRGQEDCIEMNSGMGYSWNDKTCSAQRQFLCKTAPFEE